MLLWYEPALFLSFPRLDLRTNIALALFAIALLVFVLCLLYWASKRTEEIQNAKVSNSQNVANASNECPKCGGKLYIIGDSDFRCSNCGAIISSRKITQTKTDTRF